MPTQSRVLTSITSLCCAQVLLVAMGADAEPAHPFDLVAVWLAALAWVADSRWRRLSGGSHTAALLEWVEALDLRVVALRLAQPDDFGAGDSPGGWHVACCVLQLCVGASNRLHMSWRGLARALVAC